MQSLDGAFVGHPTAELYAVMICCPLVLNICQVSTAQHSAAYLQLLCLSGSRQGPCQPCAKRKPRWLSSAEHGREAYHGDPFSSASLHMVACLCAATVEWRWLEPCAQEQYSLLMPAVSAPTLQALIQDLVLRWRSGHSGGGEAKETSLAATRQAALLEPGHELSAPV